MTGLAFFLLAAVAVQDPVAQTPGHWPQWRGPLRDGVSTETGLLREWPEGGPPLFWTANGLGEGMGCISVAGGLLFAQGNHPDGKDHLSVFAGDGKLVWTVVLGPASGERGLMRYVTQRSPSVDRDLVFATTWDGWIHCLQVSSGKLVWSKSYTQLGGRINNWAWGDSPLVDGPQVVCTTGGAKGTLTALNRVNGSVVWASSELKEPAHAPIVRAEIEGVAQYVVLTYESVAGVNAKTGKLLWKAARQGRTAVVPTPVVHDGVVFVNSGFNDGSNAIRVTKVGSDFKAEEIYHGRDFDNTYASVVRVGPHLYGTDRGLKCVELATGRVLWENISVGKGSLTVADGMLYVRSERGAIALVEAMPEGYGEKGRFDQFGRTPDLAHTYPVVAGGRLYVRDQDTLRCYDVRGPEYKAAPPVWPGAPLDGKAPPPLPGSDRKAPDAAYVPTPHDVVERMLELAKVAKADVVYDLGSGDGRILIAAATKAGCASTGYEIDPELVRLSRRRAKDAGVDALVTVVEKDLFEADLSSATVVALYLGESNNAKLLPKLRGLKAGTRIVSHQHLLGAGGPKPDLTVKLVSADDGSEHAIHVWTLPLKP